jgi:hypothetical protein
VHLSYSGAELGKANAMCLPDETMGLHWLKTKGKQSFCVKEAESNRIAKLVKAGASISRNLINP